MNNVGCNIPLQKVAEQQVESTVIHIHLLFLEASVVNKL